MLFDKAAYDNANPTLTAKEDWYNGIKFRSVLESKTAQALDNLGIAYQYEPDGYKLSNGMWYRPDFWLPYAKQFIECKGVMSKEDSAKVCGLVQDTGVPLVVISYENIMLIERLEACIDNQWDYEIVTFSGEDIVLGRCRKCKESYFYAEPGSYRCTGCGYYDGDHTLEQDVQISSGTELFNYGQESAADKPLYKEIADKFNN